MDSTNHQLIQAFVTLQFLGGSGFTFILICALAPRVHRHPTWYNFCISWVIFCYSFAMLVFAGQQYGTPSFAVCVTQSALVYAAPPLAGPATLALVVHLLLDVYAALSESPESKKRPVFVAFLVIFPWISWVCVFVGVLVFGLQHRDLVGKSENGTYCVLLNTALPKLTSSYAMVASIMIIAVELWIAVLLYRHRGGLKGIGPNSMMIRVAIFTMIGIAAIVVAMVYTVTWKRGVQFDVLIASLPASAAVIFGTQTDLLTGWYFSIREPGLTRNIFGRREMEPTLDTLPTSMNSTASSISTLRFV